ncbi:Fatty acid hydroxylase [Methylocella tundrae]|uniref:Fatty acid hydroxylase n=2 Tax=Methylocella tundrae TaxID=227605 RepID=A0A8B6M3E2_METTU|nr:sterol desaturase family protein [Methylocella tundrae]WPP04010.1 sterol desaturase family protein [Methylocella tundrae]VTZ26937.1 Fatty acid hydroxylase [Methylocella tundrae]VTZ49275.1 Fatty acid hydroxylase [Methylocella tundrae]
MTPTKNNFDYSIPQQVDRLRASPRLFDNALLDKLSRVHWSVPLYVYIPVIALLAVKSFQSFSAMVVIVSAALGYLLWTLTEYFGHRFPFHYKHPSKFGARIHFLVHGVHHDHPNDPLRLVMPVLLSAPIMLIALLVVRVLFGLPYGYPVLMGFMIGYLAYDMTHYYTHHAKPTTRLGQTLRRLHLMHHFRDPTRGFGVSAPWWDYVFGTQHVKQERERASQD